MSNERLEHLFRQIATGKSQDEILEDLERRSVKNKKNNLRKANRRKERRAITGGKPTLGQIKQEIGLKSERRTREALIRLSIVRAAEIAPPHSEGDRNMIDILVDTVPTEPHLLRQVFVQVKSSFQGLLEGRTRLQEQHGLISQEGLEGWILENKFIFLNGHQPLGGIQVDFLEQYKAIKTYHMAKDPGPNS